MMQRWMLGNGRGKNFVFKNKNRLQCRQCLLKAVRNVQIELWINWEELKSFVGGKFLSNPFHSQSQWDSTVWRYRHGIHFSFIDIICRNMLFRHHSVLPERRGCESILIRPYQSRPQQSPLQDMFAEDESAFSSSSSTKYILSSPSSQFLPFNLLIFLA